jgi:hypothetical protein
VEQCITISVVHIESDKVVEEFYVEEKEMEEFADGLLELFESENYFLWVGEYEKTNSR